MMPAAMPSEPRAQEDGIPRPSATEIQALLAPGVVEQILREDAGINWPNQSEPTDIRIERAWPKRDGGFTVEWSFRAGGGQRKSLYGVWCKDACGKGGATTGLVSQPISGSTRPADTPGGLRRLLVHVPQWNVRIHTPDRDLDMPHLARCLDHEEMAEHLQPLWAKAASGARGLAVDPAREHEGESVRCHGVRVSESACHLMGYRVGRRAAIAYQLDAPAAPFPKLVGKTYRDDRGGRSLQLYGDLNEQLWKTSQGRVRAPVPIGYLPDLQMVVFLWSEGRQSTGDSVSLRKVAVAAVDALAVLHRASLNGLRNFAVTDELAIVAFWHEVLGQADPNSADCVSSLVAALHEVGKSNVNGQKCTIHRDCYERQFAFTDDVTTVLDLDTLAHGDPCVDVGNLLAHLSLATVCPAGSSNELTTLAETVVRRYMSNGGVLDRATLAFYWGSALFRVGAIHALRTTGRIHAPALWTLARELLMHTSDRSLLGRAKGVLHRTEFDPLPALSLARA